MRFNTSTGEQDLAKLAAECENLKFALVTAGVACGAVAKTDPGALTEGIEACVEVLGSQ